MEKVAALPRQQQREILDGLDANELLYSWESWGRPEQFPPPSEWGLWAIISGRGFGKTRSGAEWVREKAKKYPGCRIALVGRTVADVRMTMVQGESGLLAVCPPSELSADNYKTSNRRIDFPNGSICETFSSESPSQLRGPQFHFAWADEVAAWDFKPDDSGLTAWDNLTLATRLGDNPQIVATTTPKRTPFMDDLKKEQQAGRAVITRGSTYDNSANLAAAYLDRITGKYEGTRLAQQELMGLELDKVDGALWDSDLIEADRVLSSLALPLRIVAVDPSVAENPRDECGIVVVGATKHRQLHNRHAYVLEDASVHGSPEVWAKRVVETARKWNAPIVAETNQGGALIRMALQSMDTAGIKILTVHASKGKQARAEPVLLPYEQHRVHHVGYFPDLEAQLTGWVPEETRDSPDRLDALVYGVTALLIDPPRGFNNSPLRARSAAGTQIPLGRGSGLPQNYARKS